MGHVEPFGGKQALVTHESGHDTFDNDKVNNWLVNNAGLGVYAHGRIHQEFGFSIFVGDLIHKRGYLMTDDILKMEEQETFSHSEPLTVNSRLGPLRAMAVLPTMSTANGEGDLIAYYRGGVVAFNTHEAPRETRHDGEGKVLTDGWDTKRIVNHMLNTVSAVGRRAVAVLTRDHLFRSFRGLHFLKITLGEGSFNSENVNAVSWDVEPILKEDPVNLLEGSAVGFWLYGNRMFATTGMKHTPGVAALPYGRGFVSWNQAVTFTEDRTPRATWEGLWVMDNGIEGVHTFCERGELPSATSFGFIASDRDRKLWFGQIDRDATEDVRDGKSLPVEWSLETARFAPLGLNTTMFVQDLLFEGVFTPGCRARALIRTDRHGTWELWKNFKSCPHKAGVLRVAEAFGKPPIVCSECTWIQVRIEGVGHAEVHLIDLDYSPSTVKSGRNQCGAIGASEKDFFEINNSPRNERWT